MTGSAGGAPVRSLPSWWEPLLTRARAARAEDFTLRVTPTGSGRVSAVLVLLGEQPATGPDVLVLERAATLRNHAGQPAFPGGAADPGDADLAATALREADEEVGLDPASVTVLAELPQLWIPVSDFLVTPVLAWWHAPHQVHPRDPGEVARVARLPVAELVDPANRLRARHPSGWIGPAFQVRGMLVWGFTAGVLAAVLEMAGWVHPWPQDRVIDLPGSPAPDRPATDPPGEAVGLPGEAVDLPAEVADPAGTGPAVVPGAEPARPAGPAHDPSASPVIAEPVTARTDAVRSLPPVP